MKHILAAIVLVLGFLLPIPTAAAILCDNRNKIVGKLEIQYKEKWVYFAIDASRKSYVEVWINPFTNTFTILRVFLGGRSCVIASGREWTQIIVEAKR